MQKKLALRGVALAVTAIGLWTWLTNPELIGYLRVRCAQGLVELRGLPWPTVIGIDTEVYYRYLLSSAAVLWLLDRFLIRLRWRTAFLLLIVYLTSESAFLFALVLARDLPLIDLPWMLRPVPLLLVLGAVVQLPFTQWTSLLSVAWMLTELFGSEEEMD